MAASPVDAPAAPSIVVAYHFPCPDGVFGALAAHLALELNQCGEEADVWQDHLPRLLDQAGRVEQRHAARGDEVRDDDRRGAAHACLEGLGLGCGRVAWNSAPTLGGLGTEVPFMMLGFGSGF